MCNHHAQMDEWILPKMASVKLPSFFVISMPSIFVGKKKNEAGEIFFFFFRCSMTFVNWLDFTIDANIFGISINCT